MTMIFLVVLFITQIISFYFIALLYMRISKFNDLEKKQNQLMREMEDALVVYLAEVKDENERLVQQLAVNQSVEIRKTVKREEKAKQDKTDEKESIPVIIPQHTMRHHARKSYESVKQKNIEPAIELDNRTEAFQLSSEGYSIEEIAKKLGKGKTEIELMLKFR